jgi:hypothetical protein
MPEADPFNSHMAPAKYGLPKGGVRKLADGKQWGQPGREGKTPVQADTPDERACLLKVRANTPTTRGSG